MRSTLLMWNCFTVMGMMSWTLVSCQTPQVLSSHKPLWSFFPTYEDSRPLAYSLCAAIDGNLLIFGGIDEDEGSPFNNELMIFTAKDAAWQHESPEKGPSPRNFAALAVLNQSIFVFGGETTGQAVAADAFTFDINRRSWERLPVAHGLLPRKKASFTRLGNQLIVFGGQGSVPITNWAQYDVKHKKWLVHESLPTTAARVSHVALAIDDSRLLVWGGFIGQERQGSGFILDVHSYEMRPIAPTPLLSPRANARAIAVGDDVFIWGGATSDGNSNSGASYNVKNQLWHSLPALPDEKFKSLKGAELAAWGSKGFVLFGGRFETEEFNNQLWLFESESRRWSMMRTDKGPPGRIAHCLVALSPNKIAVFGGIGYAASKSSLKQFSGIWILDI